MNTATFRTLMETMGIEQAWIADQLDVGIRSVARWTSPNYDFVPKEAEAWIEDWWDRFQDLVHAAVEGTIELAGEQGGEPRTVELSRYASRTVSPSTPSGPAGSRCGSPLRREQYGEGRRGPAGPGRNQVTIIERGTRSRRWGVVSEGGPLPAIIAG